MLCSACVERTPIVMCYTSNTSDTLDVVDIQYESAAQEYRGTTTTRGGERESVFLTIHNLTLLSHLTSSQRNNCHHNGPPQGGLHVKGTYQRRLSKPQRLRRLKREAGGITAQTVQEEEIRRRRTEQQEEI